MPKIYMHPDELGYIRDAYCSGKLGKNNTIFYTSVNVISAHDQNSFDNCILMLSKQKDEKKDAIKVFILYENLVNCEESENTKKLASVMHEAIEVIAVCGSQASLDYLFENESFIAGF